MWGGEILSIETKQTRFYHFSDRYLKDLGKIENDAPVFKDKKWIKAAKCKQQSNSFRAALSRSIKRLQNRGLIEKNRYKQTIFLTDEGHKLKQETVNKDILKGGGQYDSDFTR